MLRVKCKRQWEGAQPALRSHSAYPTILCCGWMVKPSLEQDQRGSTFCRGGRPLITTARDLSNSGERMGAENNDTRVSLDQSTRLMALHHRCLVLADSRRERCPTSTMATTYSVCMCSGGPFGLRLHCLFSLPSGRSAGRSRERIAKVLDNGRPHDARCAAPALTRPLVGLLPGTLVHRRIALSRAMQRTAVFRRRRVPLPLSKCQRSVLLGTR